ncbi:hypothetical protein O4J56_10005 [Nocardiopsis sp. RSe5-2]|uniref:DUF3558 domain-containing protein n=1 Tax=Nocardiopsis endophytica TaxID=3018445 RepID=A0ABT4U214_9ACTN|nr:hypothetical protein [Nocardiopsis endophytica]MDA2810968.1 hypothetical protein [Nocardiopsis endophytica]
MGRRAVALAAPLVLVLSTALSGCTGQVQLRPGPARPAASSEDGFPMHKGDELHAVNDINLVLPERWEALGSDGCLAPPAAAEEADGQHGREDGPVPCPPAAMRLRFNVSEGGSISRADLDSDTGWKRPNVVCPGSVGQVGSAVPALVKREKRDEFELVSGETVEQAAWRLKCEGGAPFETRLWLVPDADVALDVAIVDPAADYDRIARSMDLSRYTP